MNDDLIYSFRYKICSISLSKTTLMKLIQYIVFSSISLFIGYTHNNVQLNREISIILFLILPILYIFNFLYYVAVDFTFKYIVDKVTWIKDENKNNIWQIHALFFNLVTVYFFYKSFLGNYDFLESTQGVILILIIYTIFNFLHRILREFDYTNYIGCHNVYLGKKLFSLLRYKSFEHAHILSGSIIAVPFLIGLLLGKDITSNYELFLYLCYSYFLFILSWVIIHQYKCKAWEFVKSIKFILPCSVYPIFPIFYFVFFDNSIVTFYVLYFLLALLYLCPLLYITYTHKDKIELINEKLILLLILGIVLISITYRISNPTSILYPEIIDKGYTSLKGLAASLLGSTIAIFIMTLNKKENTVNRFFRLYIVLPYGVIAAIHVFLTIMNNYIHISPFSNTKNINYLSSHISAILCIYALTYITTVVSRSIKIANNN